MADIRFTVDASQAKREIASFDKALESLAERSESAVKGVNKLSTALKSVDKSAGSLERFARQLSNIDPTNLDKLSSVFKNIGTAQAANELKRFEAVLDSVSNKFDIVTKKAEKFYAALKNIAQTTPLVAELSKQLSQINLDNLTKSSNALANFKKNIARVSTSGLKELNTVLSTTAQRIAAGATELNKFATKLGAIGQGGTKISELTDSVNRAEQALKKTEKTSESTIKRMTSEVQKASSAFHKLYRTVYMVRTAVLGAFLINEAYQFTKAIYSTVVELQEASNVMATAVGKKQVGEYFTYAAERATHFGQSLSDATKGFAQLAAAAAGTSITLEDVKKMYEAIIVTGTALSMNQQDLESTFRVFVQIMSKGKLSAEELRQQLAERVPGAFALAAKAINMTQSALDAALKRGQIYSEDFIVKYAETLYNHFIKGAETARTQIPALLQQIKNTWVLTIAELENTGTFEPFRQELIRVVDYLRSSDFKKALTDWIMEFQNMVLVLMRLLRNSGPFILDLLSAVISDLAAIVKFGSLVVKFLAEPLWPIIITLKEIGNEISRIIDAASEAVEQEHQIEVDRIELWAEALGKVYDNLKKINEEQARAAKLEGYYADPFGIIYGLYEFSGNNTNIDAAALIRTLKKQLDEELATAWARGNVALLENMSLNDLIDWTRRSGVEIVRLIEILQKYGATKEEIIEVAGEYGARVQALVGEVYDLVEAQNAMTEAVTETTVAMQHFLDPKLQRELEKMEQRLSKYLTLKTEKQQEVSGLIEDLFRYSQYRGAPEQVADAATTMINEALENFMKEDKDVFREVKNLIDNYNKYSETEFAAKLREIDVPYEKQASVIKKQIDYLKGLLSMLSDMAPAGEMEGAQAKIANVILNQLDAAEKILAKLEGVHGKARLIVEEGEIKKALEDTESFIAKIGKDDVLGKFVDNLSDIEKGVQERTRILESGLAYYRDIVEKFNEIEKTRELQPEETVQRSRAVEMQKVLIDELTRLREAAAEAWSRTVDDAFSDDDLGKATQFVQRLKEKTMDATQAQLYELRTSFDETMKFLTEKYEQYNAKVEKLYATASQRELDSKETKALQLALDRREKALRAINELEEAYGRARLEIINKANEKELEAAERHLEKVKDRYEKHYQRLLDIKKDADDELSRLAEGSIYDKDTKELYKLASERDKMITDAANAYRRLKNEIKELEEEIEKLNRAGKTQQAIVLQQGLIELNQQLEKASDVLDEITHKAEEAYNIKVFQYWESQARDFYNTVRDKVSDLFVDIFDKGREGIKAFFDDILNWFKRLLAQMIAEAATRRIFIPIMMQVFGTFTPGMQTAAASMGFPIGALNNYQQSGGNWGFTGMPGTSSLGGIPGGGWLNRVVPWGQTSTVYQTPALMNAQASGVPGVAGGPTWAQAIGYALGAFMAGYGGIQAIQQGSVGGYLGGGLQLAGAGMMGAAALGLGSAALGPIGIAGALLGSVLSSVFGGKKKDDTDLFFMLGGSPETAEHRPLREADRVDFEYGSVNIRKGSYMSDEQAKELEKSIAKYYTEWINSFDDSMRDALLGAMRDNPLELHFNDLQKIFEKGGADAVVKKINDEIFEAYNEVFIQGAIDDINKRFGDIIGVLREGQYEDMLRSIESAQTFEDWQLAFNNAATRLAEIKDILVGIDKVASGSDLANYQNALDAINDKYDKLRETLEKLGVAVDETNLELAEQTEINRYYSSLMTEIFSSLTQLPGLTDEQRLRFLQQYIGAKYDVNPDDVTRELVNRILHDLVNGTEEYYRNIIGWLDTLGISFSEFISDLSGLSQAFEELENRSRSFSSTIGSFVYSITGEKDQLLEGLAELMNTDPSFITIDVVREWYEKTRSRAGLEELWAAFLDWQGIVPGTQTPADFEYFKEIIRSLIYVYEEYTGVTEDAASAISELGNAAMSAVDALRRIEDSYNSFVQDVTFSDLAPVRSLDEYTAEYNRLLANAANSPEDFRAFLDFAREYLRAYDIVSGSADNYAEIYAKILEDAASVKIEAEENVLQPVLDDVADKLGTEGPLYQVLSEILNAVKSGGDISIYLDGKLISDAIENEQANSTRSTSGASLRASA